MPGNKYNNNHSRGPGPGTPSTRLERLLRARELRKNRPGILRGGGGGGVVDSEVHGSLGGEPDLSGDEELFPMDLPAAVRSLAENSFAFGESRGESKPLGSKQRLLVVANRLPVSAVRQEGDQWSLEISAGGLVSALLGGFGESWPKVFNVILESLLIGYRVLVVFVIRSEGV